MELHGPIISVTQHEDGSLSATITDVGHAVVKWIEQEFKAGKDLEDIAKKIGHSLDDLRVLVAIDSLSSTEGYSIGD